MATIMIVDDEPHIRVITRKILEGEGYSTIEAADGGECLKMLKKEKPDLILLDVMMPGINGWEVCKRIKENRETSKIPTVMFTVRTSMDSIRKSLEYSRADAQINKPFEVDELIDKVQNLLGV
ncbi:MAG: PleD family two-component system response regulator [Candidatus Hydrothermarchaeales archaeon]